MKPHLSINTNTSDFTATLEFADCDLKTQNAIKLLIMSRSTDFSYDGKKLILPWTDLKRIIRDISIELKSSNAVLQLDDLTTKLINEYLDDRKYSKLSETYIEINDLEIESVLKTNYFERNLTLEQERDLKILLKLKHGANFSVPGSGKTTTLLALFLLLRQLNIVNKLLVIAPINAFLSWEDEINQIFGDNRLKCFRVSTSLLENYAELSEIDSDVYLINYEKLRITSQSLVPFFIQHKVHFVLDEAHRIKSGIKNLSFQQIIKITDFAKRRDILTGTPMPQSISDLYPQFDFLWPSIPIIPSLQNLNTIPQKIEIVNSSIQNYYVRTTKRELGLSDPIISLTNVELGPLQKELYRLIKSESARKLSGMDRTNKEKFRRMNGCIIRLLQASTNPMLLTSSDDYDGEILEIPSDSEIWEVLEDFARYEKPAKINYLLKRIKKLIEAGTNKIVLWTNFVRNITLLERLLLDYHPVSIYGAVSSGLTTDPNTREGRIRQFHEDGDCKILIGNPQACGEGISLHKVCHYAIYLDRTFNAAHYLQSVDRIHRLGLSKEIETKIEIIISDITIDKRLNQRLAEKVNAMGQVLNDKHLQMLAYDPEDILIEDQSGIDAKDYEEIKTHLLDDA